MLKNSAEHAEPSFIALVLSICSEGQNVSAAIDDSAEGGLTQIWEFFTMISSAPKYSKS